MSLSWRTLVHDKTHCAEPPAKCQLQVLMGRSGDINKPSLSWDCPLHLGPEQTRSAGCTWHVDCAVVSRRITPHRKVVYCASGRGAVVARVLVDITWTCLLTRTDLGTLMATWNTGDRKPSQAVQEAQFAQVWIIYM